MEVFEILETDEKEISWIIDYLQKNWGNENIVSRGKTLDASKLKGFIARFEEENCGLITYNITGHECEIVTLDSSIEGKGIGTQLINKVKNEAIRKECTRLWLITTNDNIDALRFYQKRGFELVSVHRNAINLSRKLKPSIPFIGYHGIPVKDEIELEMVLK